MIYLLAVIELTPGGSSITYLSSVLKMIRSS